jgi:hypothetical protein
VREAILAEEQESGASRPPPMGETYRRNYARHACVWTGSTMGVPLRLGDYHSWPCGFPMPSRPRHAACPRHSPTLKVRSEGPAGVWSCFGAPARSAGLRCRSVGLSLDRPPRPWLWVVRMSSFCFLFSLARGTTIIYILIYIHIHIYIGIL